MRAKNIWAAVVVVAAIPPVWAEERARITALEHGNDGPPATVAGEPSSAEHGEEAVADGLIDPAAFFQNQPPLPPVVEPLQVAPAQPRAAADLSAAVFGDTDLRRGLLSEFRRQRAGGPGTDYVFGAEGRFRATTDAGNLLGKSKAAQGVSVQQRTPIVTDPRIRGSRYGRLLASGSYWAPAREDLDTLLSKIDSRIIEDMLIIKGPYATRYGPGFDFVDFRLLPTPRYEDGFEAHGSTSLEYQTNGEQWYGRQSVWGGGESYGFRIGYGHRTGSDYETGAELPNGQDFTMPSSYKSRDLDVAFGVDLTCDSRLEFTYLRQDQTDVEFPGLVFDINFLVTNAYELKYILENQEYFDRLTAEGWYNRTRFEGDTSRTSKDVQIPTLKSLFDLADDQFLRTNVDGSSAGYRFALSWGDDYAEQLTLGTDLIYVSQQLNDIVPEVTVPLLLPPFSLTLAERNFPITRSYSSDVGLFMENQLPVNDRLRLRSGARVDFVDTNARERVDGLGVLVGFPPTLVETDLSEIKQADLDRNFFLWSLFATLEFDADEHWTLSAGAGVAQRPPTLTELYAAGPFIGTLQPGLTFVEGDPEIDPERRTQIDIGARGDYGSFRMSANAFYAWIKDYIVLEDIGVSALGFGFEPGQELQQAAYGNTELATLTGFEVGGEQDFTSWLTGFALMSYIEGRDHSRERATRMGTLIRDQFGFPADSPRSLVAGSPHEPLAGIPPLESRVGVRIHDPDSARWGVEMEARIVDDQDRVARSLFEQETPGFTVYNLRGYTRARENWLLTAGIENITNKFYREHLDFRTGRGVFRPGVNFYFGSELVY